MARLALLFGIVLFTTPISAHVLGRAAYFAGMLGDSRRIVDDLAHADDPESHEVRQG